MGKFLNDFKQFAMRGNVLDRLSVSSLVAHSAKL